MGRGTSKVCSSGGGGGAAKILTQGQPQTISTYYNKKALYGPKYNDEALDATFDSKSGELKLDFADNKDWGKSNSNRSYLDITVQNGIINGNPVNLDISNSKIKTIDAVNLSGKSEKLLRDNGFEYSSKSKKWEKGYKGYYSEGKTLHVDKNLPSDLSKFDTIKGNTFDVKSDIKKAGFKWDGANKAWTK